jgi:hypothetical protein
MVVRGDHGQARASRPTGRGTEGEAGGGGVGGRGAWTWNRAGAVERRREGGGRNHGAGTVERRRGGGGRNHGIARFEQGAAAIAGLRSCVGSRGLAQGMRLPVRPPLPA